MKKRGQVTLFIIVGLVIVSAILVFVLWAQPKYFGEGGRGLGFEGCVEDVTKSAISELEKSGGFIDPEFTYRYMNEEIPYLCYTNKYYEVCTVQKPFLKQHFEEQLKIKIKDSVDNCYSNSLNELKAEGYDVVSGVVSYDISFDPEIVRINIDAPTTVGAQRFAKFRVELVSPIYEMLMMANSILQYEAKYGDFETDIFKFSFPDYYVEKIKRGDGTTLYSVESKIFGNEFKFASRSLAWPAGYNPELF